MSNPNDFTPQEFGLPGPAAKPTTPDGQPRGDAMVPTAHPSTFAGIFSASQHSYYQFFDNALLASKTNAGRMLNDPVINSSMRLRVTPTALLTHHCEPEDNTREIEIEAAKQFDRAIKKLRGLQNMKRWLLWEGVFKGHAGAYTRWEKVYDQKTGRKFENPVEFDTPINGDKLVFKWDRTVGICVGGGFFGPTESVQGFGRAYMYTPEEREQVIVFKFEPEDADFFEPQKAGLINGCGLRHRLYYLWALKSRLWAASIDFLEWWARGILIFYFEHGNPTHLNEVTKWVETFDGQWQRLFPRLKDGGPGYKPIERIEPNNSTNQFLQTLITSYLDDLIRQIIIGQTLTTQASATGLGSGVAEAHENTFDQIVKYDANILDECLTYELVKPWYESNYPGVPHGRWMSEVDSPNVQQLIDAAKTIYDMGGNVPEEPLLSASGLPETKEGDTILTQVQPMQPAAVGGMPQGVPEMDAPQGGGQAAPASPQASPVKMSYRAWNKIVKAGKTDARVAKLARKLASRIVLTR